jgi:site-specific DNA-methyltransferase (cytosine-N4-specific)
MSDPQRQLAAALSVSVPMTLWDAASEGIRLELKPYLQPFERDLARRELLAIVGSDSILEDAEGYCRITAQVPEATLRERLTYWQRVGSETLTPTRQTLLELSQNGLHELVPGEARLHRARRLRYGVHGLHEYRGKFFPQLVRSLINVAQIAPGGTLLDPMCGSGTALVEALAMSCTAIGVDLNPLSVFISRTKSSIVAAASRSFGDDVREAVRSFKYDASDVAATWPNDLDYMQRWFSGAALDELAAILNEIRQTEPLIRDFLLVCLSNVLRAVSWQKEADLRVRKEVTPYQRGEATALFTKTVAEQAERIQGYINFLPTAFHPGAYDVREGDSIALHDVFPEYRGKVDLIVTSPPYATALPYLDTDRLSLVALGLLERRAHKTREASMIGTREVSERERRDEWHRFEGRRADLPDSVVQLIDRLAEDYHGDSVGFRRRNLPALLAKYYLAMTDAMASARTMMRPGGSAFYVVGNNSTTVHGQRVEIPTDEFLWEIARRVGWTQVETINMELLPSRDIFRDNRGSKETILWLQA